MFETLKNIGCDVEGALGRFMNDDELFIECLQLFMNDNNFEKLEQAIARKNYTEAFEAAHSIKGVSGNLGLLKLFNATSSLVECFRKEVFKNTDEYYSEFKKQLNITKAAIEEIK